MYNKYDFYVKRAYAALMTPLSEARHYGALDYLLMGGEATIPPMHFGCRPQRPTPNRRPSRSRPHRS
jgi:hypothetical protein